VRSKKPIQTTEIGNLLFQSAFPQDYEPRAQVHRTDPPHASRLTPHGAGTVLAFDFGEKRIGVAVGDTAVRIAHPLTTLNAADKQRRFAAIAALILEWRPSQLVVGLPAHLDGTEHELSRLARKFARDLAARFALPVELVDERLTSVAAELSLAAAGVAPRKRKSRVDQVAAQEILQDYFDTAMRAARSAGGAPASREQGPAERGAGTRLRDATAEPDVSASVIPAPCASPGSDPKGNPLPPCDAPRLRDATGRESGAAPSSAGVASVSGVTSPEGAPVPPSDGARPDSSHD
jgi:putative Holliday junction resolvase